MRSAKHIARVIVVTLLSLTAVAQQKSAPLSNDDVLKMVKGGLQEATIVGAIQANETNFDLSVDALLSLKQAGVSDKVLDAMLAAEARKKAPAEGVAAPSTPSPAIPGMPTGGMVPMGLSPQKMANMPPAARQQMMAMMSRMGGMNGMAGMMGLDGSEGSMLLPPEQMPKIVLVNGTEKKSMVNSMAQIAASTTKGGPSAGPGAGSMLSSLATQGLSFAAIGAGPGAMMAAPALGMVTGMFGGHHGMPTTTYVWALPARTSSVLMPTTTPRFELEFAEIVGLDPDSYEPVIVNLKQTKDNYRLVGATKAKMDFMGSGNPESMIDEIRTPLKTTRKGRGKVEIEAASPLSPGEYGVVLRPVKKHKHKKGESQSEAEQALFYSVWDFSVPGAQAEAK